MATNFEVLIPTTKGEMDKVYSIREEVFVVEQEVDRDEEFDEFEEVSTHFLIIDESGDPIGAARWRRTSNGIKMERFAVKKSWRGKGVGAALVAAVLDSIEKSEGTGQLLYMHAQLDAIPLYSKFGFEKKGEMFEECNILHYTMEKIN